MHLLLIAQPEKILAFYLVINTFCITVTFNDGKNWLRTFLARVRPLNEREIQRNDDTIAQVINQDQIMLRPDVLANGKSALTGAQSSFNQTLTSKSFTFNAVFDQSATQTDVMEKSGVSKIIDLAIEGYSTTVFCYGQTGSGKTHTLTGPPQLVILRFSLVRVHARI